MSVRLELGNLLKAYLIRLIAKRISCEKVILSDNSEFLAISAFTALCFGRGKF